MVGTGRDLSLQNQYIHHKYILGGPGMTKKKINRTVMIFTMVVTQIICVRYGEIARLEDLERATSPSR